MFIKLNKVSFITTGHGKTLNVDRTILEPLWINPNHIAFMEITMGPADCPDITTIWIAGVPTKCKLQVLETPEQITNLTAGYSKGDFA